MHEIYATPTPGGLHIPATQHDKLLSMLVNASELLDEDSPVINEFVDYYETHKENLVLGQETIDVLSDVVSSAGVVPYKVVPKITLTEEELYICAIAGARRQIESVMDGREDQHGFDGYEGWTVHIEGVCGEFAVSKYLNVHFGFHCNTFTSGTDVGPYEVRTRSEHRYDLLVRNRDDDDKIYIHVTGRAPHYVIRGWLRGHDAKKKKFAKDYGGRPTAYFVPEEHLNPVGELRGEIHANL